MTDPSIPNEPTRDEAVPVAEVDPFEIAKFQVRNSLHMAEKVIADYPDGNMPPPVVWFYAQAFGSAFTSVEDAIDNVAKQLSPGVGWVVETWKGENRFSLDSLGKQMRNDMQHKGKFFGLRKTDKSPLGEPIEGFRYIFFQRRVGPAQLETYTLGEWALFIFLWWADQIAQLERLSARFLPRLAAAESSLGRPMKMPNFAKAEKSARKAAAKRNKEKGSDDESAS